MKYVKMKNPQSFKYLPNYLQAEAQNWNNSYSEELPWQFINLTLVFGSCGQPKSMGIKQRELICHESSYYLLQ